MFWNWFAERSNELSFLCSTGDLAEAHFLVNEQLSGIAPGLCCEIVSGYRAKYRFAITLRAQDDPALQLLGREIMAAAPDRMQGWEFCLVILGAQPAA